MPDIVKVENKIEQWATGTPLKLEELYDNVEEQAYISHFETILNTAPKESWIKNHPYAKGVRYIPIEKQEFLMSYFFGKWWVEVKQVQILANSIAVTVRVHYYYSIKGSKAEWRFTDGVGAVAMQVEKGANATDFTQIKSNAVMIGLPAAKSYAFKDAVESLGKIFGKDLNRKDEANYGILLGSETNPRFEYEEVSAPDLSFTEEEINDLKKH